MGKNWKKEEKKKKWKTVADQSIKSVSRSSVNNWTRDIIWTHIEYRKWNFPSIVRLHFISCSQIFSFGNKWGKNAIVFSFAPRVPHRGQERCMCVQSEIYGTRSDALDTWNSRVKRFDACGNWKPWHVIFQRG